MSVSIVLNIKASEESPEAVEHCLSIARTVCQTLENRNIKYDFFSNIIAYGSTGSWDYIGEGLGQGHFQSILEGLGRASHTASESFAALVERVLAKQKQTDTRSIIIVTPGSEIEARVLLKGRDNGRGTIISGLKLLGEALP